jgi:hypothetical protein
MGEYADKWAAMLGAFHKVRDEGTLGFNAYAGFDDPPQNFVDLSRVLRASGYVTSSVGLYKPKEGEPWEESPKIIIIGTWPGGNLHAPLDALRKYGYLGEKGSVLLGNTGFRSPDDLPASYALNSDDHIELRVEQKKREVVSKYKSLRAWLNAEISKSLDFDQLKPEEAQARERAKAEFEVASRAYFIVERRKLESFVAPGLRESVPKGRTIQVLFPEEVLNPELAKYLPENCSYIMAVSREAYKGKGKWWPDEKFDFGKE